MKKNYDSIDLFKFIFSILIVALHADALYDFSPLANAFVCGGIARLGVPFFFVASAFFFFKKLVTWNNTKKYCKRLLILYAAWFIVSLPKTVFDRFICSDYPLPETIFRFIRSFFVTSTFSGSWFIVSCIWCALLFYLLEKQKTSVRRTIVIALSILVYAWTVFTSAYGNSLENLGLGGFYAKYTLLFGSPYCSFIVGIPYFAIGRYFAVKDSKKQEGEGSKRPIAYAGLAACLALLLTEVRFTNARGLTASTDCYIMLLPTTVFLFMIIKDLGLEIKRAKLLRVASTILFFSQFILLFTCELAEWAFKIMIPNIGKFLFAALFGLFLTWLILKLQDKKGFGWLRRFY